NMDQSAAPPTGRSGPQQAQGRPQPTRLRSSLSIRAPVAAELQLKLRLGPALTRLRFQPLPAITPTVEEHLRQPARNTHNRADDGRELACGQAEYQRTCAATVGPDLPGQYASDVYLIPSHIRCPLKASIWSLSKRETVTHRARARWYNSCRKFADSYTCLRCHA